MNRSWIYRGRACKIFLLADLQQLNNRLHGRFETARVILGRRILRELNKLFDKPAGTLWRNAAHLRQTSNHAAIRAAFDGNFSPSLVIVHAGIVSKHLQNRQEGSDNSVSQKYLATEILKEVAEDLHDGINRHSGQNRHTQAPLTEHGFYRVIAQFHHFAFFIRKP